jgi:hypothetical protein
MLQTLSSISAETMNINRVVCSDYLSTGLHSLYLSPLLHSLYLSIHMHIHIHVHVQILCVCLLHSLYLSTLSHSLYLSPLLHSLYLSPLLHSLYLSTLLHSLSAIEGFGERRSVHFPAANLGPGGPSTETLRKKKIESC